MPHFNLHDSIPYLHVTWRLALFILTTLLTVFFVIRILTRPRNIGATLAWIVVLLAFPLIGGVLYVLIGEPRLGRRRAKLAQDVNLFYRQFSANYLRDININESRLKARFRGLSRIAAMDTELVATDGNQLTLLSDAKTIFAAMCQDIEAARFSCLLEFYIIDAQGDVEPVLQAVLDAANRGVHCHLLADGVGSLGFLRSDWCKRLRAASVQVEESLGVGLLKTLFVRSDLRNHRKIVVIDHEIAYTGSFNLVDPLLFKQDSDVGQWVDVMMRCHGPAAQALAAVVYSDLATESERRFARVRAVLDTYVRYQDSFSVNMPESDNLHAQAAVQVIPSAPDQENFVIYETIICALHMATSQVVITTPYFIPDEPLLVALTTAARRGVRVTLILPEKNDSFLVRLASRAYYRVLLDAGVKIAFFENGLLHSKIITIDDEFTLFGTVNMDMRSFYLNLEVSLGLYDKAITQEVYALQKHYLANSTYLQKEHWRRRNKLWVLLENAVRLLSPLL